MICTNCYHIGEPKTTMMGSFSTELLLWVLFFWFWFIPGIIYTIWRYTTKTKACPKCGKSGMMIPEDSRRAKEILGEYGLQK